MKHLRNGFYFGILLLILLAACGPATSTPVVLGPVGLAPTSTPTTVSLAPLGLAPTSTPLLLVLGPLGLAPTSTVTPLPACIPPAASVNNVQTFCGKLAKGGLYAGATFNVSGGAFDGGGICHLDQNFYECAGASNEVVNMLDCTGCGSNGSAFVCANFWENDQGSCIPDYGALEKAYPPGGIDVNAFCLPSSHYDNALQNCVDDNTLQPDSPCPAGFPYYDPTHRLCYAQAGSEVFNCQSFTLQLGDCGIYAAHKKSACKPPVAGCPRGQTWNPSSCSCK